MRLVYIFIFLAFIAGLYVHAQSPNRQKISQTQTLLSVLKNIEIRANSQIFVQKDNKWKLIFGKNDPSSYIELHKVSSDGRWAIIVYHQRQIAQEDSRYDEVPILLRLDTQRVYYPYQLPQDLVLRDLNQQAVSLIAQDKLGAYLMIYDSSKHQSSKFYLDSLS